MKIIETPRDAMQGVKEFIPTSKKIEYINALLTVGFDVLDFGSFVSPKAIPQLQDTAEVLASLDESPTKLLAIVANERGVEDALKHSRIDFLGYPFSISETFQWRNTKRSIEDSVKLLEWMQEQVKNVNTEMVVYLSMGFGNPYGDDWSVEIVEQWVQRLLDMGINTISLSDTVGVGTREQIEEIFQILTERHPEVEFGAHFHVIRKNAHKKIKAAYRGGCKRFDTSIHGFGGCPMATDDLIGNLATEDLIDFCDKHDIPISLNMEAFQKCQQIAKTIWNF